jgi:hypothetical protein
MRYINQWKMQMPDTTKVALRRPRFKLHSFSDICRMSPSEWDDECRRNGADMEESPEDQVVQEIIRVRSVFGNGGASARGTGA